MIVVVGERLACGYHNWDLCVADDKSRHSCQHAEGMVAAVRACMGAQEHGMRDQSHHDALHAINAAEACKLYLWEADHAECTDAMQSCCDNLETSRTRARAKGLHKCVNNDEFMTCIARDILHAMRLTPEASGCTALPEE